MCDQTNNTKPNDLLKRLVQHAKYGRSAPAPIMASMSLPKISDDNSLLHNVDGGGNRGNGGNGGNGGGNGGNGGSGGFGGGIQTNCNADPSQSICQQFCQFQPNAAWCNQGPTCQNVTTCEPDTTTTALKTITADTSDGKGPNQFCTIRAVTQLSQDAAALKTEIDAMSAGGNTNLVSAISWAWKTISPNSPYAGYKVIKPYNSASHEKVIVFMTDGDNTWGTTSNSNDSYYSPFGFFWNKRLGKANAPGKSCNNQDVTKSNRTCYMDAMTLKACEAAKTAGVKIYTIGFSTASSPISSSGQSLLQSCASSSSNYYLATNASQLNAAFAAIGDSLQGLHISR